MRNIFLLVALNLTVAATAQKTTPLTATEKSVIIDSVALQLEKYYVFPDKAKSMTSYLRKRNKEKAYATLTDYKAFVDTLAQDLQRVHKDLHLSLSYNPQQVSRVRQWNAAPQPTDAMLEERKQWARKANFGFVKVERLPGNIGYLDFRNFFAVNEESENTVAAAMAFLLNTDAVIIDLRKNGGGDPEMVQLILSYFMDEKPVHYNSIYNRPTDSTQHFYSLEKVKGQKMPGKDLYILTSRNTFSAAEEFAYNFKNLKKALLIGETTGGGAHPTSLYAANNAVVMAIPMARSISPITQTNWEGTGVEPDVKVEASKALAHAQKQVLQKAMAKATDPMEKAQLQWVQAAVDAELNPVTVGESTLQQYVGQYGDRTITLEGGQLYYQRAGRGKMRLLPLSDQLFQPESLDYFRVQFVKDAKGNVEKIIGLYDSGQTDESPRTAKTF